MSAEAIAVVDEVITSLDRLSANLKRQKSVQIRSSSERALIKATAHAWFNSHRARLLAFCGASGLGPVDITLTTLLELADKHTTRSRYRRSIKTCRGQLIALRSTTLTKAAETVTSVSAPDFSPLVQDVRMRGILERRWRETSSCIEIGAHLAATVMMGGLLEGLLLARVNRVPDKAPIFTAPNAPKDKRNNNSALPLKEWMLKDFLDVAHDLKWIGRSAKDVGVVVRDYRNYIHPQKELTHGIELTSDETSVLWSVFATIATQVIQSVSRRP